MQSAIEQVPPADLGVSLIGTPARARTPLVHRLPALLVFVVLLFLWSRFTHAIGMPENPLNLSVWIWFATIAWNIDLPRRNQLVFLRDWWPVMVGLSIYWFTRGYTDQLGIPVHVRFPVRVDDWIGGGRTPTEILQQHWCGLPCTDSSQVHWYDVLFTTVYSTHFITGLTIGGILWLRNRTEFRLFMRRYVAINYAALVIYFIFPMAPPWLAAQDSVISPDVRRISGRGWGHAVASHVDTTLSDLSNPTAAMPSLHTAVATTIALYAIWRLRSPWRWLMLLYPLTMATALVYFGEHYVVDVVAGALLACLMMLVIGGLERWFARRRAEQPLTDDAAAPVVGT